LGQGRSAKTEGYQTIRITRGTYEIIRTLSNGRRVARGEKEPTLPEIVDDLLEVAFRCIEDHHTDFAKPFQGREALERARIKVMRESNQIRRPPGRPPGVKDSKPRKRRK